MCYIGYVKSGSNCQMPGYQPSVVLVDHENPLVLHDPRRSSVSWMFFVIAESARASPKKSKGDRKETLAMVREVGCIK